MAPRTASAKALGKGAARSQQARNSKPSAQLAMPAIAELRPFFGYYGGKWRDTGRRLYPPPQHRLIVEPFAGSAGYSLRYHDRDVVLCELDEIVVGVWQYLLGAKASEIRAIPDLPPGGSVDDLKLIQEQRWLVGFWLNRGTDSPRRTPSRWMREGIRPGSFWGERVRETIASQLESIKHWKVYHCSYAKCPVASREATWFVDPPYQTKGRYYRYGSTGIDYDALASWSKSRKGQVIVCENNGADWLPFRLLTESKTTRAGKRSSEVVWTKDSSHK